MVLFADYPNWSKYRRHEKQLTSSWVVVRDHTHWLRHTHHRIFIRILSSNQWWANLKSHLQLQSCYLSGWICLNTANHRKSLQITANQSHKPGQKATSRSTRLWQKIPKQQQNSCKQLACAILCVPYHFMSQTAFTARCTLVQSAVLRSHVVCLSVRLCSVTLVDYDHNREPIGDHHCSFEWCHR